MKRGVMKVRWRDEDRLFIATAWVILGPFYFSYDELRSTFYVSLTSKNWGYEVHW